MTRPSRPRNALDDDVDAAVGHLGHLADRGDRADRPQVGRLRVVARRCSAARGRAAGRRRARGSPIRSTPARLIASGCSVSGNTTVCRSASTGSSLGYVRAGVGRHHLDCTDGMIRGMALDERDFFNNRNETRTDKLTCPRCKRVNDYQMRWVVRTREGPHSARRRRARPRAVRQAARLHDPRRRFGHLQDLRQEVRHSVAAFDGLPRTRRGSGLRPQVQARRGDEDSRFNR